MPKSYYIWIHFFLILLNFASHDVRAIICLRDHQNGFGTIERQPNHINIDCGCMYSTALKLLKGVEKYSKVVTP
uniref:Secreted protein n=1 Tax=Ditylenchus dipsaci TaxID=166011 RepID=A0A915EDR8_9BILA